MATQRTDTLSRSQCAFVRANATTIAQLPSPDADPWLAAEANLERGVVSRLSIAEIIDAVDTVSRSTTGGPNTTILRRWRTLSEPYAAARTYATHTDTLPCCPEGTGISTRAAPDDGYFDGRWYECNACGCAHAREIAAEVIR